jgi:hypothetical protein
MKVYEYSKHTSNGMHYAHICANAKTISVYMETSLDADTIKQADRIIRNHGFEPIGESVSDSKGLTYVQFNVWYYDFEYNDKRVKTFTCIEDATQFICALINDYKYRFINLESVY